ncbi:hypothetical protein [Chitinivibrio alkaliphilus]|uniref:Uncharacterized protein n=1 Tax=Chitinivibrio alkaliphilus ACht1 TaxID=1313304 RepID=U7D8X9_9BACT|nr:hypothetical protein [Chitinivibrio alkaliphilus]ERP32041.1 hypothetical protein CALK_1022 [Chitinivibrio alkaliphilus ACht1]
MIQKVLPLFFMLISLSHAHGVLLMAEPVEDSMVYIEGGLTDGSIPVGANLVLHARATGRPIWQGKVPEEGHITIDRPDEPYTITLMLDRAHSRTITGPLESNETEQEKPVLNTDDLDTEDALADADLPLPIVVPLIIFLLSGIVGFYLGFRKRKK